MNRLHDATEAYRLAADLMAEVQELEELLKEAPQLPGMMPFLNQVKLRQTEAIDILQKARLAVEKAKLATATQLERKRT